MDEMPTDGFRQRPLWLLGVVGLVIAQAGLTLSLFGPARSFGGLLDGRPVLSGRHPLHLYHGTLGAREFQRRGATNCYDPGFQAGYPKTPVFDGGCRPAELFLILAGTELRPDVYKIGLFVCLLLIPLAFVVAGRGAGLPAGASVLAGGGGIVLGWSLPVHRLIGEGEIDVLLAGLAVIVFVTWLGRYARWYGVDAWLVLAGTAVAGWYAHPLIWLAVTPILIAYYLVYAPRRELAWHLGLLGVVVAGAAPNLWWLVDWARFWWIRQPSGSDHIPFPDGQAILGTPEDYLALLRYIPWGLLLVVAGSAGLATTWRAGNRCVGGLLILMVALAVGISRVVASWSRMPPDGAERLITLAAGFTILPAGLGLWTILNRARLAPLGVVVSVCGLILTGWADGPARPLSGLLGLRTEQLTVGFSTEHEAIIAALKEHTTSAGRVLWDETTDQRPGWNWSALLPLLTDRAYLGGLDPGAGMDFSFCGLRDGNLNGRALADWNDRDLADFCTWYNVGWVVCRSAVATDRWAHVPGASVVARLKEGGRPVVIYALDRPLSFILRGTGKWESASPTRITLTDVTPDANGEILLSLHHIEGLRVYPTYITLGSRIDHKDPLSHVKLGLPGRLPRLTLVWENP